MRAGDIGWGPHTLLEKDANIAAPFLMWRFGFVPQEQKCELSCMQQHALCLYVQPSENSALVNRTKLGIPRRPAPHFTFLKGYLVDFEQDEVASNTTHAALWAPVTSRHLVTASHHTRGLPYLSPQTLEYGITSTNVMK